jgi:hypothetical protein
MSPNSANKASADEAQFKTSGIPLQNSKLVVILLRFCLPSVANTSKANFLRNGDADGA